MSEEVNKEEVASSAPVTAKQNNTVKYVVIAVAVLAVLGYASKFVMGMIGTAALNATLSSEGVHVSGNPVSGGTYTVTDKDGNTVKVDTSNNGTYNATDNKGNTVTVGSGAKLPDDFPAAAPVYANAVVTGSTAAVESGKKLFTVTFESADAFEAVTAFYKKSLAENGWKTLQEMNQAEGYTMYSAESATLQANVMIEKGSGSDSKTSIVLSVGPKS